MAHNCLVELGAPLSVISARARLLEEQRSQACAHKQVIRMFEGSHLLENNRYEAAIAAFEEAKRVWHDHHDWLSARIAEAKDATRNS